METKPSDIQINHGTKDSLVPWISLEKYESSKRKIINDQSPLFKDMIMENRELFIGLDDRGVEVLADNLSVFVFGVLQSYRRLNVKSRDFDITINSAGLKGSVVGVTWNDLFEDLKYEIDPREVVKVVRHCDPGGRVNGKLNGMDRPKIGDYFEFSGVEEGDHFNFIKSKRSIGRPAVKNRGLGYEYFTSDMEYSALLRKLSYARQYKPEYVLELDMLRSQAKTARIEAGYYDKTK
jgi:hypothetical protein